MGSTATVRATVYGSLVAALALLLTAPTPAESVRRLADAGSAVQVTDPLVALLALLAWCCAAYLLTVAALAVGGRVPGVVGDALRAVVRRIAPSGLRRALELSLGVTLAVGTLGGGVLGGGTAFAAGPADGALHVRTALVAPAVPAPQVAPDPAALPSLDHPSAAAAPSLDHPAGLPTPSLDHPASAAPTAPAAAVPSATPDLDHPVAASPATASPAASPAPTPSLDWPGGRPPAPAGPARPAAVPAAEQVVVQPGDSLWSIAEESLEEQTGGRVTDAQVAQAWPSWWQANREEVGADPDLLRPGTPLTPPPDS